MWITIITIAIPLIIKLIEWLRDRQASGKPMTERQTKIVNKLNHVTHQLRAMSASMGLKPEGVDEDVSAFGAEADE